MNIHQKAPDQLSRVFLALAHPIRRNILSTLTDGDTSVSKLAEPFKISLVAMSKHLKILEKAGLISSSKDKQVRLSHFQPEPLKDIFMYIKDYRQFWDESFDKLEQAIEEQKKKEKQYESADDK